MPVVSEQSKKAFGRAAHDYQQYAKMQWQVLSELIDKITVDSAAKIPQHILDLGCGVGWAVPLLLKAFPNTRITAMDFSEQMLAQVPKHQQVNSLLGNAHQIELPANSIDLVLSNLMIQWCDAKTVLQQIYQTLKPGGCLYLTGMGEKTLFELKAAWQVADQQPHVNDFLPLNQLYDLAKQCGYQKIQAKSKRLTMYYQSPTEAMKSLKNIGATNVDKNRAKGLMTAKKLKKVTDAYQQFKTKKGLFPTTYEVTFLYAEAPG